MFFIKNLIQELIYIYYFLNSVSDGYRAPEITDEGTFSPRSDIYALGKIINDIYGGAAPPAIRALITKCTHYFSEDRYNTVDELLMSFCAAVDCIKEAS